MWINLSINADFFSLQFQHLPMKQLPQYMKIFHKQKNHYICWAKLTVHCMVGKLYICVLVQGAKTLIKVTFSHGNLYYCKPWNFCGIFIFAIFTVIPVTRKWKCLELFFQRILFYNLEKDYKFQTVVNWSQNSGKKIWHDFPVYSINFYNLNLWLWISDVNVCMVCCWNCKEISCLILFVIWSFGILINNIHVWKNEDICFQAVVNIYNVHVAN